MSSSAVVARTACSVVLAFTIGNTALAEDSRLAGIWLPDASRSQRMPVSPPFTAEGRRIVEEQRATHDPIEDDPGAFCDEALAAPLRMVQLHINTGELENVEPFIYNRCIQSIVPINGFPQPVSPAVTIEFTVLNMLRRPWAEIWVRYFEDGMSRPESESIFEF